MVAAGVAIDSRRATELARNNHQRVTQHAAGVQIVEQGGDGTVEVREEVIASLMKLRLCVSQVEFLPRFT